MHKEVKFKGPSVLLLSALWSFNSHKSGNFHPNEKIRYRNLSYVSFI